MKTFLITWISELNSKVFVTIPAQSMQAAIRLFLMRRDALGLNDAVCFNITKMSQN